MDKVEHLKGCSFYTDNWNAFAEIIPADIHIIGESMTHIIERDNGTPGIILADSRDVRKSFQKVRLWLI
ncbi:MAG: hypothetical protein LBC94_06430 [Desulfovibrio sp.]|jgi:IS1 family transposase|nr:hypothetical protein [Desulfovibrio sp.]